MQTLGKPSLLNTMYYVVRNVLETLETMLKLQFYSYEINPINHTIHKHISVCRFHNQL